MYSNNGAVNYHNNLAISFNYFKFVLVKHLRFCRNFKYNFMKHILRPISKSTKLQQCEI